MKITVINDLHLGVNRTGGTTTESAQALREYTHAKFKELLVGQSSVVINGDMFDSYQVPTLDLLLAYQAVSEWAESFDNEPRLWLIPGNHDLAKNSANLSSFELLAMLLTSRYPYIVKFCPGGGWIDQASGLYAISHVANQDLFEIELGKIPAEAKTCLLHCNYDNEFAGQSDHSLNLPRARARELTANGLVLVFGHEHQGRTALGDKVILTGNQFPTSVSDCLSHGDAQKDGRKYCLVIDGEDMELVPTWSRNDASAPYTEADWQDLGGKEEFGGFIRVTGKVAAAQSADVIKAISKFRQASKAFVVTNAVKVDVVEGMDQLSESVEDIRGVNVLEMLLELLEPEQRVVVIKLLESE